MSKLRIAITIAMNLLMILVGIGMCVVIVGVCQQGGIPEEHNLLYTSAMAGGLFVIITTMCYDICLVRR